jgi:hypothetical protein
MVRDRGEVESAVVVGRVAVFVAAKRKRELERSRD